jgi:monofunctional biosynthetic peptidoglycan transglycosylase
MTQEKLLYSFDDPGAAAGWMAINDVVMGGVSTGGIRATGEGTVLFAGRVSLENNGGFASLRSGPRQWDLESYSGIAVRVRGDGQRYKIHLKTDFSYDGISYRVPFQTDRAQWQTIRFPFAEFQPSFRGRTIIGAPPLDPRKIATIGFLISDKQAGKFRLEIDWITAYRDEHTGEE